MKVINRKKFDNILVGGSGFIGSVLADKLSEKKESVLNISRHLDRQHPGVEGRVLDVSDRQALKANFPAGANVFILIGQNGVHFNKDREMSNLKNLIIVLNKTRPKRVFYLSSVLVYGERSTPAAESDATHPIEIYSRFKAAAEQILKENLRPEIALGIFRLANVYGNPKNRGFTDFVMRRLFAESSEQISVNGDGTQERDYIFIDDAVSAMLAIRDRFDASDTINIASGKSYSLIELIKHISRLSGKVLPYAINGVLPTEVTKSRIANRKLREKYGFNPQYSFDNGLLKTFTRYQNSLALNPRSHARAPKKAILLLGGEGFIGRNLAFYFSPARACFSVGKKKSSFTERTDTFIQANPYTDKISAAYDTVIHLIDNKLSLDYLLREEEKLTKNITLNEHTHLILFSSSVIYADPTSEYSMRKRVFEKFYLDYCQERGIPLTIFRLFNTFGLFQLPYRQGSLVANLIYNYLQYKSTEINDMDARRDYMYSQDIAKFIEYAMEHKLQGTFDLGSGKLVAIHDLITLLEQDVLKDSLALINKNTPDTTLCRARMSDLFQSIQSVPFAEGLVKTVAFYRAHAGIFREYVNR